MPIRRTRGTCRLTLQLGLIVERLWLHGVGGLQRVCRRQCWRSTKYKTIQPSGCRDLGRGRMPPAMQVIDEVTPGEAKLLKLDEA